MKLMRKIYLNNQFYLGALGNEIWSVIQKIAKNDLQWMLHNCLYQCHLC